MPPEDGVPDEIIISRVLHGRTCEFRTLIERYQQRIYSLGMQFFRNAEDASDFVQEVFIRAYRKLQSFRGESRFYTWLMRVAYNHGVNSLKRAKTYVSLADESIRDESRTPERQRFAEEAREALRKALTELPEKYVVCIDLYFFYDLSHEEISRVTGFPVNTIKSHVFRGKKLLREALKGTAAEDYHEM
jgi:RNA polymerase sigma-70 factor (ECF subfamily)